MIPVRSSFLKASLFLTVVGAAAGTACATDAALSGGTRNDAGTGGATGYNTGGAAAGNVSYGGSNGTGGKNIGGSVGGTVSGYTFVGTVTPAPNAVVSGTIIASFTSCASDTCQAAHCVPESTIASLVPAATAALLGKCSKETELCVPDDFIATLGKFEVKTCKSVDGFEGRCLSTCIPEINKLAYALPQDVCAPSELCAPCYYPWPDQTAVPGVPDGGPPPQPAGLSGPTGACSAGVGDAPKEPRTGFQTCGSDRGVCVPRELVPATLLPLLPVETCTQEGHICAPILKVMDLNAKFPNPCSPQLAPFPADPTQPAACVPKFIIDYYAMRPDGGDGFASLLTQSNCPLATDICAPCTSPDPLVLDHNTHACE